MKKMLISLILVTISIVCFSQKQNEKFYMDKFAEIIHGRTEVVLSDKTRADIVTDTFAIEVDFAHKWAESIGQALHYSINLHKNAGILLLIDGDKNDRFIKILLLDASQLGITVWTMDINNYSWKKRNHLYIIK